MCDEQYYPWCPESDADWNLIASAPELLALLVEMEAELKPGPTGGNDYHDAWQVFGEQIRAAIAKAEGKNEPIK